MPALLSRQTTDITGPGVRMDGPCWVHAHGYFASGRVIIEAAREDVEEQYAALDISRLSGRGWMPIPILGTYWIRAVLAEVNPSLQPASVTVTVANEKSPAVEKDNRLPETPTPT